MCLKYSVIVLGLMGVYGFECLYIFINWIVALKLFEYEKYELFNIIIYFIYIILIFFFLFVVWERIF